MHHTDPALALHGTTGSPRAFIEYDFIRVPHASGEEAIVTIDPVRGLIGNHVTCKYRNHTMSPSMGKHKGAGFDARLMCTGCGDIVELIWNDGMSLSDVAQTIAYKKKS